MKVAVTGGAGYIGQHLVKRLLLLEHEVVIIDSFRWAGEPRVQGLGRRYMDMAGQVRSRLLDITAGGTLTVAAGSLGNEAAVAGLLKDVDVVVHLAGTVSVEEAALDPPGAYANNVTNTIRLIRAMIRANTAKLVFASTCAVYGEPQYLPLDEMHPVKPLSAYSATKWDAEVVLRRMTQLGIDSVVFRFFNVAGNDMKIGEIYERDSLMARLSKASLTDGVLEVFGNDFEGSPDGSPVRDYVHVEDIVDALVSALEIEGKYQVYNLGTGVGTTVLEICQKFTEVTSQPSNVKVVGRREGDVPISVASYEKAYHDFGWKPRRRIEQMILESYQWNRLLTEWKMKRLR